MQHIYLLALTPPGKGKAHDTVRRADVRLLWSGAGSFRLIGWID
jgi:hypothetical protein